MFCPYCGTPCAENHKFCFRCGKPLPELTAETHIPAAPPIPAAVPEVAPVQTTLPETEAVLTELPEQELPAPVADEPVVENTASDAVTAPSEPVPQPKKGRLWPPLLVLCAMICIGLAAFFLTPKAPEPVKSCFTVESGVLYFDASLYTGGEELTVPATIDGMTVTIISENCFADCDQLTTIILPESVTVIGDKAFAGCDSLRGIYFPEGVLSIGANALAQCPVLEAVYFPGTIVEIGEGCLDDCTSLQFIIYSGTYTQWRELYDGTFQNQVELHTNDGVYRAQP